MNLENYYIRHRHRLFGQTTKQPLNKFEPWKHWKYKQLWGLIPDPSFLEKKISVRKIKAELFKQYVMSLKEAVCKYRGQIEMECNSENTSDANGVHLEGNFLFSLSFFVTRNRNFWPMYNYFFL